MFSNTEDLPYFTDSIQNDRKVALVRGKGGAAIRYRPGHVTAHFRRHNPVFFSMPQMDSDIDVLKGNPHGRLYNTTSLAGHLRLWRNASRNEALKTFISSLFFRAILSSPAILPDKMESMRSGIFRKKKAEKR